MGSALAGWHREALMGQLDVLLDPTDDMAVTRGLLARHNPAAGLLVVHPTPTVRQLRSLAHDVLTALGAPVKALHEERLFLADVAWRAVQARLTVERVMHLVVLRAHRLDPRAWTGLAYLAQSTLTQLLLVCHTPAIPPRLLTDLGSMTIWPFHSLAELVKVYRWDTHPLPVRRRPTSPAFPDLPGRLPTSQVMHYRADVYRRHSPEVFARVDELYGRGVDVACQWLRGRQPPGPGDGADARIQEFVTQLVHDTPSPQHTLALLRGAQAGFILHGCWLTVPNLSRLGGPGCSSRPVTYEIAQRIRGGTANPVMAAGVALALFTGVDPIALRSVKVRALSGPSHLLTFPYKMQPLKAVVVNKYRRFPPLQADAVFYVPRPVRPLLRTTYTFLTNGGADPTQRIFHQFTPVHLAIEQAAARCGVQLPHRPVEPLGLWQLRVRWGWLGESFHAGPPDRADRPG